MDIKLLVNLTSRAWALPILAAMHEGVPGRQAPLLTATGATRTAFAQSMTHLIALGMIERNPGYGHPLRPEFRLTEGGKPIARMADRINSVSNLQNRDLLRRSWTVPILTSLRQPRHFGEVRKTLSPITDRALSQSLKSLEERDWIARSVDTDGRPPRSSYRSINQGQAIAEIIASEIDIAI